MSTPTGTSSISVGDRLPPLTRTADLAYWNRYAAVNDEFIPIHMDDEAGRAAGYPTAFGMGNLVWSYLTIAVREWLGDRGRITALSCQFRGATTRGMTVTVSGAVTAVRTDDAGRTVADLEVVAQDQDGNALTPGTATVVLDD